MLWLRTAAVATAATTYALFGVVLLQQADVLPTERAEWIPLWLSPVMGLAVLAPATVGLLIALRQPRNRVAWIMLVGAATVVAAPVDLVLTQGWTLQADRATWPLLYAWPIAVAYVFPNGRLLTPRWRFVAATAVASFVTFMTLAMLDPSPFYGEDAAVPNPLAENGFANWLLASQLSWLAWTPWLGILFSLFAGALAIALRLRRSSGVERLQTLWLAWAAGLIPIALVLCSLSGALGALLGVSVLEWVVFPLLLLIQAAIAAAVGVAVVRYRLYAIERIVNRTIVYATLTVLLGLVYAGVVVGFGVVLGRGSAWVTAAATLAVAVGFRPLRAAVQHGVDRRFSRARYDAVRRVRAFEEEVREGRRRPEEVGAELASALGDPGAELRFWLPASSSFADTAGTLAPSLPEDGRACTNIEREGGRTAVLLHDPELLLRRDLLDGVLGAATLSLEMARLRVELRIQLSEVEASRARIVEAGYEERRRLERDLHDGAQQRLVSLGMRVRRLQRSLPSEARVLGPALDQIVDEVGSAISDLRQIAAGVRPARLDDGLAAALHDLAHDVPIPVEVEVDARLPRVAASLEAAAYFVACEALTNAVKHAAASRIEVRAVREQGVVRVQVVDDGVGGAVARRGSGLAGLRDRVAAHGGTLQILSPPGGGTRVEVALPCES